MKKSEFVERIASSVEQFQIACLRSHEVAAGIAKERGLPVSKSFIEDPIVQAIMAIYRMHQLGIDGPAASVRIYWVLEKAWEGYQEQQEEAAMVGGGGG